ncbi:hypothetical protein AwWohl_01260 [Gammaproteobacteria bacterium]|nr:hypothetical protein AwWohl_01260 [Gammaproteobacteria bacterium]
MEKGKRSVVTIIDIPEALNEYTPVIDWLLCMFKNHNEIDTETRLHEQLRYLLRLHKNGENLDKLAHDLSNMECWQTRTIALSSDKIPIFWNPLDLTFNQFKKKVTDYKIKVFDYLGANPPKDIIYDIILRIKALQYHPYLDAATKAAKNV